MNPLIHSIRKGIDQTFVYTGRTGRAEYWWYILSIVLLGIVSNLIFLGLAAVTDPSVALLFRISLHLAVTLTTLSATVRRLHDTGKSTYWIAPAAATVLLSWALAAAGFSDTATDAPGLIGVLGITAAIAGLASLPCWIFMFFRGDPDPNRYGPHRHRRARRPTRTCVRVHEENAVSNVQRAGIIGAALALAAFFWLPLPLVRHANVNLPCHLLAERAAAYVEQRTPVLIRMFAEQELLRIIKNLERNRNGLECAANWLGWVVLDWVPLNALKEAERR